MEIASVITAVILFLVVAILLQSSIKIVPQERAYIVERLGRYNSTLNAGLNFLIPFIDKIAAKKDLREIPLDIPSQSVITADNITMQVDGVIYYRIIDPKLATYGISDLEFSMSKMAQTTLRSALGKLQLDKTFESREEINMQVTNEVNSAAKTWGAVLLRYEIKDIVPPESVMSSMEKQMRSERERRALVLAAEGKRQSEIEIAEGEKQSKILLAQGEAESIKLKAEAEANAIKIKAEATAQQFQMISEAISTDGGSRAMEFELMEQNIAAKAQIAKESSIVVLPDSGNDLASILGQATVLNHALSHKA